VCESDVHHKGMISGYARVSPDGQSVEAQVAILTTAGAVKVYRDIVSGAKTDRAQLRQVLARLTAGDVRLGTRLDRRARSTRDLLNTLAVITGTGAGCTSLGDAWADTTTGVSSCLLSDVGEREAGHASGIALVLRMPRIVCVVPAPPIRGCLRHAARGFLTSARGVCHTSVRPRAVTAPTTIVPPTSAQPLGTSPTSSQTQRGFSTGSMLGIMIASMARTCGIALP
jgi:hypothetical protein